MADVLDVIFFERDWSADEWHYDKYPDVDAALQKLFDDLRVEFEAFSIELRRVDETLKAEIRGYGDLLNSMRISYPSAGVGSYCLGHIIGASQNLDIVEDLRRGVNRVAFAPETVEPAGSDKVVCHNCGCGC